MPTTRPTPTTGHLTGRCGVGSTGRHGHGGCFPPSAEVRWYTGEHGPGSPLAIAAPACCITCGFMIRLNGPLGRVFGVCANEFAPDDGCVVSVDHGCGAHSDGDVMNREGSEMIPTVDEVGYDMVTAGTSVPDSLLETIDHELL